MQNQNKSNVRFPGETLILGGEEYVVPALSFRQLRLLDADLKALMMPATTEQDYQQKFDSLGKVAHAALSRNYPELSIDQVEELLDMHTVKPMIQAVLAASGFNKAADGGAVGEERPLIGTGSTPTS